MFLAETQRTLRFSFIYETARELRERKKGMGIAVIKGKGGFPLPP
jgi:ribosomal protein S8